MLRLADGQLYETNAPLFINATNSDHSEVLIGLACIGLTVSIL